MKKPELQIVISLNNLRDALETYKDRWKIESTLSALKQVG